MIPHQKIDGDPKGVRFFDGLSDRHMMLVSMPFNPLDAWILYRGNDGSWYALRQAEPEEVNQIENAQRAPPGAMPDPYEAADKIRAARAQRKAEQFARRNPNVTHAAPPEPGPITHTLPNTEPMP